MAASLLFTLIFAKIAAFALTVSSGGSGGIFAPCLFVGAMLGGFLAKVCGQPSTAFVIVGIVAVFGAAARVSFATALMVAEMTGGYRLSSIRGNRSHCKLCHPSEPFAAGVVVQKPL